MTNHHLILSSNSIDNVEMYLNEKGEIFVWNQEEDARGWFFVINKDDWEEIKKFIDHQFSE